ncbi:unnamed protein product [Medioppia subpectinata]|uniref:Uncharacterized protein n=1 Tax=Medioppia subpectinata TaxID=1979941 RepID=A0A7R9PUV5_9ACAR|nr:unnamed protein product [Medioppia subpectinata]CAG2101938.1 unnamed protein product [Medioppia subpectinata]
MIGSIVSTLRDSWVTFPKTMSSRNRKLAQIRCEVVQLIFKKKTPQPIPEVDVNESEEETQCVQQLIDERVAEHFEPNATDKVVETKSETNCIPNKVNIKSESTSAAKFVETDCAVKSIQISDSLIPELIERVRVTSDLNHNMCVLTVKTVIECLSERIPEWSTHCVKIMDELSKNTDNPNALVQSSDLVNLKSVFRKLSFCKNDEQQRNNPIHRDEEVIRDYLDHLLQIISNANPALIKDEICGQNYERIDMLVAYYQMETRRSLRMKLYSIFICLISLFEDMVSDFILTSVLPSELVAEMQHYMDDTERWCSAALVFTAIFSTGHKPPINIYSHINEKFITEELDLKLP